MAAGVSEYIERVETDGGEVESDIYVSESVEDLGDFFDDASLVNIPTAYKATKLYSIKPTDGSGDFTFARSTTATRVNEAGLIEKERENLLLQSNQFDTTWTTSQASLTGGQTGYDGSNDGWLLESTVTGSSFVKQLVDVSSSVSTLSIYAKSGNVDWCYINAVGVIAYYDLSNGIVGTTAGTNLIDTNIESVGNGWYRISITGLDISEERIYPATTNGNPDSAVGDNIYIQDAQLEAGLVATDYIETTTSTVATGITTDVPRIDYSSGTPALLLEPQRSNIFPQSEYLGSGGWVILNGTLTTNYATSPEGVQNAAKINFTSGGEIVRATLFTAGQEYTFSFYAKVESGTFDFTYGNIAYSSISGTATTEWQRFQVTQIAPVATRFPKIDATDTGDLLIYGMQLEQGSYPTSYIPTSGTSVTRIRDLVSTLTSVSTNGIINNYNTTVFLELQKVYNIVFARFITLFASGGVSNPRVLLFTSGINDLRLQYRVSGQSDVSVSETIDYNTTNKICFTINNNTLKLFVNGVLSGSATIVQGDPIEDLDLVADVNDIGYLLSKVITFPTALTDAECITLTTI